MKVIEKDRVAVITGAALGIGQAAALKLAGRGMKLALFDHNGDALDALKQEIGGKTEVLTVVGDVTCTQDLQRLHDATYAQFGEVALLMNNAATMHGAPALGDITAWRRLMDINFFAILEAQNIFLPSMLAQNTPAAVINLGSKEGITTPPTGNAAYNVSKAALKVLTEQLAHDLRNIPGCQVSACLFVPGYTWTPMNGRQPQHGDADKKPSMWTAEQLMDYFLPRFENGDFYVLCPDNDVNAALDAKRIRWAAEDMIQNRPALSRWHPHWQDKFAAFIQEA